MKKITKIKIDTTQQAMEPGQWLDTTQQAAEPETQQAANPGTQQMTDWEADELYSDEPPRGMVVFALYSGNKAATMDACKNIYERRIWEWSHNVREEEKNQPHTKENI